MSARPILRESAALVHLKAGAYVAIVDPTKPDAPPLRVEEVEHVGERELRTAPIGTLARVSDRGTSTRRWSRKTGAPVLGGAGVIRPATPREVAVWKARQAVDKARTEEQRRRDWRTTAEQALDDVRDRLSTANANCARETAEHLDAQRKLAEAEDALAAAEAGAS